MGELFRKDRPEKSLAWTGERLVTDIAGTIEIEHLHRYFLARELCRGKEVLDIASGEGYGTALLAQTASHVIGVEVDYKSVEHASDTYKSTNLTYIQGEAIRLPLGAGSVDVVVSFETLEHFFEHEVFFEEVNRVLRPNGFLVISTPDSEVYSGSRTAPNPFHVRELTKTEFSDELQAAFRNVFPFRQRVIVGSAILPDAPSTTANETWVYERRDAITFEGHRQLPRAPYLVAVASNATIPPVASSLYIQTDDLNVLPEPIQVEFERLQGVEAAVRKQSPAIEQAMADFATAREQVAKLSASIPSLESELAHLRKNEEVSREKIHSLTQAVADATAATDEALQKQATLTKELGGAKDEAQVNREQLNSATLLARQQALVTQRLQADLRQQTQSCQALQAAASRYEERCHEALARPDVVTETTSHTTLAELRAAREEAARYAAAYNDIRSLIIPIWMRKLVPSSLKPGLRAIKKAVIPHN